jgi:flavin reductase (DIM6/NTAB) family NADH-FMN oxidoreductase RutF
MSMLIGEAREDVFKEALGSFASGVTVITVRDADGRPCGMTANAFSSVSLAPLLVLVCLNRSTRTHKDVSAKARFGVNILHRAAIDISNYCARPGYDKVLRPEWLHESEDADQPPILSRALAYLDCTVTSQMTAGTHSIVLGQVKAVGRAQAADPSPLVYFRGRYCELKGWDSVPA